MRKGILWIVLVLATVAAAWMYFPRSPKSLAQSLVSKNDDTRNLALMKISRLSDPNKSKLVDELLVHTADPDWQTRRFALYALRKTATDQTKIFPVAMALLEDPEEQIQKEAVITLTEMGPEAIRRALKHEKPLVRAKMIEVVGHMNPKPLDMKPDLILLLKDSDPLVRSKAAIVLNTLDPTYADTVPVHIETVKQKPWTDDTAHAIKALGVLGPKAKAAVPALNALIKNAPDSLKNKNAPRPLLAQALNKIDLRPNAVVGMTWDLKNNDPLLRYRAAYAFSEMSPPAEAGILPELLRAMDDKDVYVRARVTVAAARIGFDKSERLKLQLAKKAMQSLTVVKETQVEGYAETIQTALNIKPPAKDEEAASLNEEPAATAP